MGHPSAGLQAAVGAALIAAAVVAAAQEGPALSLADAVRIALERSPDVAIARHRVGQANAQLRKTYAPFSPQGSLDASQVLLGHDQAGELNRGERWDRQTHRLGLSANWNVFNGFRDLDRWTGARHDRQGAAEALRAAQRQVALQTVQAYFGLLVAEKATLAQQENLNSKREHHELALARFRSGVRSYSDVLNAQVQLKQSEIQLLGAEASRDSARHALNLLLDRPLESPTVLLEETDSFPLDEGALETRLQAAFQQRPELLEARAALGSAQASQRFAFHDILPAVSLGGLYKHRAAGLDATLTTLPNPLWEARLGLSFPFWSGGSRFQELRRSREATRSAAQAMRRTERVVAKEVSDAHLALRKNHRVQGIAQSQVEAAREGLKIVQERYRNGGASVLEVVDAQANLLRVQLEAIQSLNNLHVARYELQRAMGVDITRPPTEGE